jgi:hypothetical protein
MASRPFDVADLEQEVSKDVDIVALVVFGSSEKKIKIR